MKLSICIPTYNRAVFLSKNIGIIINSIKIQKLFNKVEIIISDNNSTDDTSEIVKHFILSNPNIFISYFKQEESIPIYENQLYTVEKSSGEYFMWMGDDDFFVNQYLQKVITFIEEKEVGFIVSSYKYVDINGKGLEGGRDLNLPTKIYNPSFRNCLINSWRGHQMSGLVFKTSVLNEYRSMKVDNMYPFIYFSAFSCLNEKTLHLTEFPIIVTRPGQENKAWDYGEDGLLNDIFDNYNKLEIIFLKKTILQLSFFTKQPWRLLNYEKQGFKVLISAFFKICFSKNSTFLFKLLFPLVSIIMYLKIKNLNK
jgi:abequosyltransferase